MVDAQKRNRIGVIHSDPSITLLAKACNISYHELRDLSSFLYKCAIPLATLPCGYRRTIVPALITFARHVPKRGRRRQQPRPMIMMAYMSARGNRAAFPFSLFLYETACFGLKPTKHKHPRPRQGRLRLIVTPAFAGSGRSYCVRAPRHHSARRPRSRCSQSCTLGSRSRCRR